MSCMMCPPGENSDEQLTAPGPAEALGRGWLPQDRADPAAWRPWVRRGHPSGHSHPSPSTVLDSRPPGRESCDPRASESTGPGPASRAQWALVSSPALQPTPRRPPARPEGGLEPGSASPCRKTLASQPSWVSGGARVPQLAEDRALTIAWCAVGWGVMRLFHKKARPSSLEAGEG